jgi:hypothetical protein
MTGLHKSLTVPTEDYSFMQLMAILNSWTGWLWQLKMTILNHWCLYALCPHLSWHLKHLLVPCCWDWTILCVSCGMVSEWWGHHFPEKGRYKQRRCGFQTSCQLTLSLALLLLLLLHYTATSYNCHTTLFFDLSLYQILFTVVFVALLLCHIQQTCFSISWPFLSGQIYIVLSKQPLKNPSNVLASLLIRLAQDSVSVTDKQYIKSSHRTQEYQ